MKAISNVPLAKPPPNSTVDSLPGSNLPQLFLTQKPPLPSQTTSKANPFPPINTQMPADPPLQPPAQNPRRRHPRGGGQSPCQVQVQVQLHPCPRNLPESRPPFRRLQAPPSRRPWKHPQHLLHLQEPHQHLLRRFRHLAANSASRANRHSRVRSGHGRPVHSGALPPRCGSWLGD